MRIPLLLAATLALTGCVSTIGTIVTAPVKVAAKAADWATTSRDEADRNRGRELRKAEARARKSCQEITDRGENETCRREELRRKGF